MIVCRGGELMTEKFELVHPIRLEILADLVERRTQELKTVLEGRYLPSECQILLHSLSDDAYWVGVDVLEV